MRFLNFIDNNCINNSSKIAQIYDESILTYGELKKKSDALALYINNNFKNDNSPIIIYGHKEHEMLIAFIACSKSGHSYIPIDVTFPKQRI